MSVVQRIIEMMMMHTFFLNQGLDVGGPTDHGNADDVV